MADRKPVPPPEPRSAEDKYGWHRRFTWHVSQLLARKSKEEAPITPESAGQQARVVTRGEFQSSYPGFQFPEWMP